MATQKDLLFWIPTKKSTSFLSQRSKRSKGSLRIPCILGVVLPCSWVLITPPQRVAEPCAMQFSVSSHLSKIITSSMLQAWYCQTSFPDNKIDSGAFSIHRSLPQLLLTKGSFIHYITTFITAGQLKNTWGRVMNWKDSAQRNRRALTQASDVPMPLSRWPEASHITFRASTSLNIKWESWLVSDIHHSSQMLYSIWCSYTHSGNDANEQSMVRK